MNESALRYHRVVLKMSGEAFGGCGIDSSRLESIAGELRAAHELGVELAVVVGGGNFIRGERTNLRSIGRTTADYMGMVATVINSLALQETLASRGVESRILSAIEVGRLAEPFLLCEAIEQLKKRRVLILAGGTGNPFVTTDTCAAIRAGELSAEAVLKATKVDGVYSSDPHTDPAAQRYPRLSYRQYIEKQLRVMDAAAVNICEQRRIPIIVFDMNKPDNIVRVVRGETVGTVIGG